MDLELAGRRAVVTGASRGLGLEIARQLLLEGVRVVGGARTEQTLREAADRLLRETGAEMTPLVVDTGSDESVRNFIAGAREKLGGIDILVNNAANPAHSSGSGRLADVTESQFFDEMNVKVMGYLRCAREVAPVMSAQGWGRIINISGLGARLSGRSAIHSIRNIGVTALTKNLADELGPQGVNVTVVYPGVTRTEATDGIIAATADRLHVGADEAERRMGSRNSLGRIIGADEVAWVVTFLASPKSVSINGDAVACGGGWKGAIYY
ncbi:MAG: SDR family NAD(P)-dependent oxidoreductase [Acidimicrobiia bacterium]